MIQKIANKIYLSYKIEKIALQILEAELTEQQKKQVDWHARFRDKNLTFGQMFNSERTYFPIGKSSLSIIEIPQQIQKIIDKEGYYCPDYRKGYVYKKDDKLKNKPVKLIKILSKGESDKDKFNKLKKQFDERLSTSRKQNIKCEICITHNPYDVAGMSTGRNWTSCMNLDNGAHSDTPLKQVQFGGMCAYLIQQNDKNIEKPIARIAIKRLIGNNNSFMFVAENVIYGDVGFANELDFMYQVVKILNESNKKTMNDSKVFFRDDNDSYSDSDINWISNFKNDKELMDFIEDDPYVLNEDSFMKSLTNYQRYLLFDYLIELNKHSELVGLFYGGYLNNDEVNKMIDSFIYNNSYYQMKLFLRKKSNLVDERKRVIRKLFEGTRLGSWVSLIEDYFLTEDQINFIIDCYIDLNSTIRIKELLIYLKDILSNEQKDKLVQHLLFYNEYQAIIDLMGRDIIEGNYINDIAESMINLPEEERSSYYFSRLISSENSYLTKENKQKIIDIILEDSRQYDLYDLLDENQLDIQQQVMAAKQMIDNGYHIEAYEHIFGLIKENKFDNRIKGDVLDIILQDVNQRYDNGQVNQTYLNEIKEEVDFLR